MAVVCWLQHLDDAGWMDTDSEDDAAMDAWVRRDNVEFVYNSQEHHLLWLGPLQWYQVPWRVRIYALQSRMCSLHRVHAYSLLRSQDLSSHQTRAAGR